MSDGSDKSDRYDMSDGSNRSDMSYLLKGNINVQLKI